MTGRLFRLAMVPHKLFELYGVDCFTSQDFWAQLMELLSPSDQEIADPSDMCMEEVCVCINVLNDICLKNSDASPFATISDEGDLPLHIVSRMGLPVKILRIVYDYFRVAINVANSRGMTPLHCFCLEGHLIKYEGNTALEKMIYLRSVGKSSTDKFDKCGHSPLHLLIETKANLKLVEKCTRYNQVALVVRNNFGSFGENSPRHDNIPLGSTPLMMAINFNCGVEVIEFLVNQCPQSVFIKNELHDTPFHSALSSPNALEVLKVLVTATSKSNQAALMVHNKKGQTVLDVAVLKGVPVNIIELLVAGMINIIPPLKAVLCARNAHSLSTNQSGLYFKPDGSVDVMYGSFCANKSYSVLSVNECTEVRNDCAKNIAIGENTISCNVIFEMCCTCILLNNKENLEFFVVNFKKAAMSKGTTGQNILHFAAMRQASIEILQLLLELDDGQLAKNYDIWKASALLRACTDSKRAFLLDKTIMPQQNLQDVFKLGYNTLMYCCIESNKVFVEHPCIEKIMLIAKSNPDAFKHRDEGGFLPFDAALQSELSIASLQKILNGNKDAIKGNRNAAKALGHRFMHNTPLHLVVCRINPLSHDMSSGMEQDCPLQKTKWIYSLFPGAIEILNDQRCIPLHNACKYGAPANVVSFLMKEYVQGNNEKDIDGNVPLGLALHPSNSIIPGNTEVLNLFLDNTIDGECTTNLSHFNHKKRSLICLSLQSGILNLKRFERDRSVEFRPSILAKLVAATPLDFLKCNVGHDVLSMLRVGIKSHMKKEVFETNNFESLTWSIMNYTKVAKTAFKTIEICEFTNVTENYLNMANNMAMINYNSVGLLAEIIYNTSVEEVYSQNKQNIMCQFELLLEDIKSFVDIFKVMSDCWYDTQNNRSFVLAQELMIEEHEKEAKKKLKILHKKERTRKYKEAKKMALYQMPAAPAALEQDNDPNEAGAKEPLDYVDLFFDSNDAKDSSRPQTPVYVAPDASAATGNCDNVFFGPCTASDRILELTKEMHLHKMTYNTEFFCQKYAPVANKESECDSNECCMCMHLEKTTAFSPCGHRCVCAVCAGNMQVFALCCLVLVHTQVANRIAEKIMAVDNPICPACRAPVHSVLRVFC